MEMHMIDMPADLQQKTETPSSYEQVAIKKETPKPYKLVSDDIKAKGMIKIPPKQDQNLTYVELDRSKKDEETIYELITTMADNGKVWLLFNKSHMNQMGEEIGHVHPLKFLGYIFAENHLKRCMARILEDYFKRNGFIDGLGPSLDNELKKGALYPMLNDFCEEIGIKPYEVESYFQKRDWDGLLRYLCNH